MNKLRAALIGLGACAATLLIGCRDQQRPAALAPDQGTVVGLIDGDTIDITIQDKRERVRVLGVDTPETKKPDVPVQCFGPEASAFTAEQFPVGTVVDLLRDEEARDGYGRLLAAVRRHSDGFDLSLELVRGGYAKVLVIKPNIAQQDALNTAQDEARRLGKGLWGACPTS
jgi:micrococcal nuclease